MAGGASVASRISRPWGPLIHTVRGVGYVLKPGS